MTLVAAFCERISSWTLTAFTPLPDSPHSMIRHGAHSKLLTSLWSSLPRKPFPYSFSCTENLETLRTLFTRVLTPSKHLALYGMLKPNPAIQRRHPG